MDGVSAKIIQTLESQRARENSPAHHRDSGHTHGGTAFSRAMVDATAATEALPRQPALPDLGGFRGRLVQHILAYAHGLNKVADVAWCVKVPNLLCRSGWPHARAPGLVEAHYARLARDGTERQALAGRVRRAKLLRAACLNPLYAWLGLDHFVRHVDVTRIPERDEVFLPPHLATEETYRLDRYAYRGRAGFLADMDLIVSNAAAFASGADRAIAAEAAAIARAARAAPEMAALTRRLLALRGLEARVWQRRQARIGALDDDAQARGRAMGAYEDLLAELEGHSAVGALMGALMGVPCHMNRAYGPERATYTVPTEPASTEFSTDLN